MLHVIHSCNELSRILDVSQDYCTVVDGISGTEGPAWDAERQTLFFNEVATDSFYCWSEKSGLKLIRRDTNYCSGNFLDAKGRVVCCEQSMHRITRMRTDGSDYEVMASHYNGLELNSPNDLIIHSNGVIYFSDPHFNRRVTPFSCLSHAPQPIQGVYGIIPEIKKIFLATGEVENPNGLCFSPDEKIVYIADSALLSIFAFDVAPDGCFVNKRLFARTYGNRRGVPDGIKCDAGGNVYCAAQGGVHVFSPTGDYFGILTIPYPEQNICFNLCFGGPDYHRLFLCCMNGILSLHTKLPGALA